LAVVTGAIQRRYALASGIAEAQIAVFPDAPTALEAVAAGRADAYGGTSLTVRDLLAKADDARLERAAPFTDPVVDGRPVRGYGAFVFRKDDDVLRTAFDLALADFVGTEAHLALVAPFGFTRENLPGDATAEALCRQAGEED
jgi:polar amino acid transport system substrate-binding protein